MMRIAPLLALAAIACTTTPDGAEGSDGQCDAEGLGNLTGREGNSALAAEALRRSGARTVRWIWPDSAVTMDFRQDRLNLRLDRAGRIEGASCG